MSLVRNFLIPFSGREYRILKQYFSLDSDFSYSFFKDSIHIETNVDINFPNVTSITKLFPLFYVFLAQKIENFFPNQMQIHCFLVVVEFSFTFVLQYFLFLKFIELFCFGICICFLCPEGNFFSEIPDRTKK